jgi:hypothetical protein
MVVISCLLAAYEALKSESKKYKGLMGLIFIFQIIFLHILGAKTGLISAYMTLVIGLIFLMVTSRKWYYIILIPLGFLVPVLAYKTIPTFKSRINYIRYDWQHYSQGNYVEGLSDAIRYFSIKAGISIIKEKPLVGHGFSRLQRRTNQWYADNVPHMKESNYFLPSSEILIYWSSGGILGLIAFLLHIFVPLFDNKLRKNCWFIAFFIPAVMSFTFETHLEGLLPLWVYGFFTAWFWYLSTRN